MSFVVIAKTHLNFFPGTITPTPPDYRRVLESRPYPSREEANANMAEMAASVESPGWEFGIEERPDT